MGRGLNLWKQVTCIKKLRHIVESSSLVHTDDRWSFFPQRGQTIPLKNFKLIWLNTYVITFMTHCVEPFKTISVQWNSSKTPKRRRPEIGLRFSGMSTNVAHPEKAQKIQKNIYQVLYS